VDSQGSYALLVVLLVEQLFQPSEHVHDRRAYQTIGDKFSLTELRQRSALSQAEGSASYKPPRRLAERAAYLASTELELDVKAKDLPLRCRG
jgi:hypothetical protein